MVSTIQHGIITKIPSALEFVIDDFHRNPLAFGIFVPRFDDAYHLPKPRSSTGFFKHMAVIADYRVGRFKNTPGGPVILLQL